MDHLSYREYTDRMHTANTANADDMLIGLNEPQRQAVTHRDGPLLVLAGPGSGKTRVITRRAAYLVRQGVPPSCILAITFTNKAADQMRQRIGALGVAQDMWIYTFHALGARLLHQFGERARVRPNFTIYDQADQLRVVKAAIAACELSEGALRPDDALGEISRAKNRMESPQAYAERADFFEPRMIARVYEQYEALLERHNAVDFDDLLMRVAIVLRDHPEIVERLNARFRYLLIDEYQDTNHAQYLIAHHLSRHHRNICVTGDPDQSIYGWRGADISNILEFERDHKDATVVRLEQNYRSTGHILRVASSLIRNNRRRKHKELWTDRGDGRPVEVLEFDSGEDEARQVAACIAELRSAGRDYADAAICYRVNAVSRGLEEALRGRGIPYKIARGLEFYNRKEIRDVLGYLRVLVNPDDQVSLQRILNTPARGIGKTTEQRLLAAVRSSGGSLIEVMRTVGEVPGIKPAAAKRIRAFVEMIDAMKEFTSGRVASAVTTVLSLSGLEAALKDEQGDLEEGDADRLANVQELVSAAARYDEDSEEPSLVDFLRRVALTGDQDAVDESAGCVMLMTLHAAKGLEFPVVFMVGMEQGLLPHERSLRSSDDIEEERRLAFVGITRAKERLILSHARQRTMRGMLTPRSASQFLYELPADEIDARSYVDHFDKRRRIVSDDDIHDYDQLPPDEIGTRSSRWPKRTLRRGADKSSDPIVAPGVSSPFAGWSAGTFVQHAKLGVGQIVWIRPAPGQTRAAIRFPRVGERVFILELAPVKKLSRSNA
ncbi:MAG: UvrD-helicase domain-containing protein [Planctomycetes bacterium]|nr:UvrD-helicase domain-containing protein [Planctomycetota bacterium]